MMARTVRAGTMQEEVEMAPQSAPTQLPLPPLFPLIQTGHVRREHAESAPLVVPGAHPVGIIASQFEGWAVEDFIREVRDKDKDTGTTLRTFAANLHGYGWEDDSVSR